jgi:hypothetical protein
MIKLALRQAILVRLRALATNKKKKIEKGPCGGCG